MPLYSLLITYSSSFPLPHRSIVAIDVVVFVFVVVVVAVVRKSGFFTRSRRFIRGCYIGQPVLANMRWSVKIRLPRQLSNCINKLDLHIFFSSRMSRSVSSHKFDASCPHATRMNEKGEESRKRRRPCYSM